MREESKRPELSHRSIPFSLFSTEQRGRLLQTKIFMVNSNNYKTLSASINSNKTETHKFVSQNNHWRYILILLCSLSNSICSMQYKTAMNVKSLAFQFLRPFRKFIVFIMFSKKKIEHISFFTTCEREARVYIGFFALLLMQFF